MIFRKYRTELSDWYWKVGQYWTIRNWIVQILKSNNEQNIIVISWKWHGKKSKLIEKILFSLHRFPTQMALNDFGLFFFSSSHNHTWISLNLLKFTIVASIFGYYIIMYIPPSFSNNKYANWVFFKYKRFKFSRQSERERENVEMEVVDVAYVSVSWGRCFRLFLCLLLCRLLITFPNPLSLFSITSTCIIVVFFLLLLLFSVC